MRLTRWALHSLFVLLLNLLVLNGQPLHTTLLWLSCVVALCCCRQGWPCGKIQLHPRIFEYCRVDKLSKQLWNGRNKSTFSQKPVDNQVSSVHWGGSVLCCRLRTNRKRWKQDQLLSQCFLRQSIFYAKTTRLDYRFSTTTNRFRIITWNTKKRPFLKWFDNWREG